MSFVGDLLGLGGKGSGFQAQSANILQPTTQAQLGNSYGQSQQGINQQQAFLNALAGQNGIQNQANVFNQQQALANQLQGVANGTGPNPALQQLQNTTGQNVANQAALMAGQRGSGANAGLLARQIAQQGANTQQQAAGQGAALAAQQQLSGLGMLQGQQGMLGSLANQQVGQQAGALQGYNQAAQSEQQNLLNALQGYNNSNVGMMSNINNVQGSIANGTQSGQQGLLGGLLGGAGSTLGALFTPSKSSSGSSDGEYTSSGTQAPVLASNSFNDFGQNSNFHLAKGGMIPKYAEGGPVSNAGKFLYSSAPSQQSAFQDNSTIQPMPTTPTQKNGSSGGGGLLGGIEKGINGIGNIFGLAEGGPINAKAGLKVPGKASVKGDSLKNDTVPAMLSPGEVVIPRHVMQSDDPIGNSAKFVQAVMSRKGSKK